MSIQGFKNQIKHKISPLAQDLSKKYIKTTDLNKTEIPILKITAYQ